MNVQILLQLLSVTSVILVGPVVVTILYATRGNL